MRSRGVQGGEQPPCSKISSEILLHISTGEIEVENLLTGIAVLCGEDISAVLAKTNAVTVAGGGDCEGVRAGIVGDIEACGAYIVFHNCVAENSARKIYVTGAVVEARIAADCHPANINAVNIAFDFKPL